MKAKLPNGIEIEGTPKEIREYMEDEPVQEPVQFIQEPDKFIQEPVKIVKRQYAKKRTHQAWTRQEDQVLLANWHNALGHGDRTKYSYNKAVARKLSRTYSAAYARVKALQRLIKRI